MAMVGKALAGIALVGMLLTVNTTSEASIQQSLTTTPERVSEATVPGRIAFTSNQRIWIFDAHEKGSEPVQVTREGSALLVGWSHDGEWLLYMHYPGADLSDGYLWAASKDASTTIQLDERPVRGAPKWAPYSLQVAYVTEVARDGETKREFVIKAIKDGKEAETVSTSPADFADFTWMPDGEAFLVSTQAEQNRPMTLSLRDLNGNQQAAYPIAEPPDVQDGIYPWAPMGMQVSPDGRFVAYYVQYNSASLSADGVPIQLFDLGEPSDKPLEIGEGLAYREWLAWSPDSKQLAFINGGDRMATHNKRLRIIDPSGNVIFETEREKVASFPVWTSQAPYSLAYTSGIGVSYEYDEERVLVPGQRIWKRDASGEVRQLATGSEQTADTFPALSSDGGLLLFVRLDAANKGALYVAQDGKESELLRQVTGEVGYYGNYLPKWIDVYWDK